MSHSEFILFMSVLGLAFYGLVAIVGFLLEKIKKS